MGREVEKLVKRRQTLVFQGEEGWLHTHRSRTTSRSVHAEITELRILEFFYLQLVMAAAAARLFLSRSSGSLHLERGTKYSRSSKVTSSGLRKSGQAVEF